MASPTNKGRSPAPRSSTSTVASGRRAERLVRRHYRLRAYRILGANVWIGGYEIDLILRRGRRLIFCEVKSKGGQGRGDPLEMVSADKERRLRQAAETWLGLRPELAGLETSFEVVAVRGGRVERIPDAF